MRHLETHSPIRFKAVSLTDPTQVLFEQVVSAGEAAYAGPNDPNPEDGGFIGYPYIIGDFYTLGDSVHLGYGCRAWHRMPLYMPADDWLTRFSNTAEDGWAYYDLLGYPRDLTWPQWNQSRGIRAEDLLDPAAFYNPQEFGLGRRVVCKEGPAEGDVACCVSKHGHLGDEAGGLDGAIRGAHTGDTVCMEYSPGPSGERIVKFLVFGSNQRLTPTTVFDTSGPKGVPAVCGHCHGRTKDWQSNQGDTGGRFVFFDVPAYRFAHDVPGFTRADQEEKLRGLNALVKRLHGGTGPYAEYIDALYPTGVERPGAVAQRPGALPGWVGHEQTYVDRVRPNCRTCHIWQTAPYDFARPDPLLGASVRSALCGGSMPNAWQPMANIWRQLDPFPGDAITAAFGVDACFSNDAPPQVEIVQPAGSVEIPVGGFMPLTLQAAVSDAEDGPDCCSLAWHSDLEGPLGSGPTLTRTLGVPGRHTITVTARDRRYRVATDSVEVTAVNEPPAPRIRVPAMDDESFFEGVPYLLRGEADDTNHPLGLPCDRLSWRTDRQGDPVLAGCHPEVVFEGNGARTLTLTADDGAGGVVAVSRRLNVPDPPLNAPPIVAILAPVPDAPLDGLQETTIRLAATDPDQGATTWILQAKRGFANDGDFVEIGRGACAADAPCRPEVVWRPADHHPPNCGGYEAELWLQATDDDGTGQVRVRVWVRYAPC